MSIVPLDLIAERVNESLAAFPSIKGAYLFGSALENGPVVRDIDLGLIVAGVSERESELIEAQAETQLGYIAGKPFDVTVLDERSIPFAMKVVREGRLIYISDLDVVTDFIERVSLAWREIGPRYERARREVLEEVRAGGHRP